MAELEAVLFRTPAEWRSWPEANAEQASEVWVGLCKRGAGGGRPDVARGGRRGALRRLDRQSLDDRRRHIRFTPRSARSIWSTVNVRRVAELEAEGRMLPAGRAAFARRQESRSGIYSHEQPSEPELDAARRSRFDRHDGAWEFLQGRRPRIARPRSGGS